jgi:hypothetical protein
MVVIFAWQCDGVRHQLRDGACHELHDGLQQANEKDAILEWRQSRPFRSIEKGK